MLVEGHHRSWEANDEMELAQVLHFRDAAGGALFWLNLPDQRYPVVSIRISGDLADVHYFPGEDHPGFRALVSPRSGVNMDETIRFRFEGCDPASGEDTPRRFALPFTSAVNIACEFYRTHVQPASASWFEL